VELKGKKHGGRTVFREDKVRVGISDSVLEESWVKRLPPQGSQLILVVRGQTDENGRKLDN